MSTAERNYPDPTTNLETARYWAAAREGRLLIKSCNACGEAHHYPREICPHCGGADTEWREASGKGRIYSYSVMRRTETPYVIAYVTLDEGVTMMTNIVDADFDAAIGKAVEVTFRETEGGMALPVFRLAGEG